MNIDRSYFQRRADEEKQRAANASTALAGRIHAELAQLHAAAADNVPVSPMQLSK